MSRKNNIRWRDNDRTELRELRRKAAAKVSYQREKLIKKGKPYEASQLPKIPTVKEFEKNIQSRKDYNREIAELKNFIKTGNKFSIDKNTEKSLHATVRDFGTKVDRLYKRAKTQGERAALPQKITSDELLKMAPSKEGLKQLISEYKGFLKPGAEELVSLPDTKHNIRLTKWQNELMEDKLAKINEARAREREIWKETDVKYGGKSAGYKQGQARMDKGDFDELHPMKKYNFSSTHADLKEKLNLMMRESQEGYWETRTELARLNYVGKLERVLGNDEVGKELLKKIKGMPLDDFKRTLLSEDDIFLLLYDLETQPENYETLRNTVWNEWFPDRDIYEVIDEIADRTGV